MEECHAEVSWCAEDIKTLRPAWSDERCCKFFEDNVDHIQCSMIEAGWAAIESLLPPKESE